MLVSVLVTSATISFASADIITPLSGHIRTDRQTYNVGDTIYVNFGFSGTVCPVLPNPPPCSNTREVTIVEVLPDGTSFVAFDREINPGREYTITGMAGTPPGLRTLTLCVVYNGNCDSLASTSFEVVGGYTTYQPPPQPPSGVTMATYQLGLLMLAIVLIFSYMMIRTKATGKTKKNRTHT